VIPGAEREAFAGNLGGNTTATGAELLAVFGAPASELTPELTIENESLGDGGAVAGLVNSAKTQTSWIPDTLPPVLAFPSADLVGAAAGMFPASGIPRDQLRFQRVLRGTGGPGDQRSWAWAEVHEFSGPLPALEVGPGMVRFRTFDAESADRTRARNADAAARAPIDVPLSLDGRPTGMPFLQGDFAPMWSVYAELPNLDDEDTATRGDIRSWSPRSRNRLRAKISRLDLAPIVGGESLPVTLTLPGDWLAVTPTAVHASKIWNRFAAAYRKRWGSLRCLWKREFQRRGAPHWHLWLVPPVAPSDLSTYRAWLSKAWTRALQIECSALIDCGCLSATAKARAACRCDCDRDKSLKAGTGVDQAEGVRARDPRRLADYFLKESLGGEEKAYQNDAPREWDGQSIGRFWGVCGLDEAVSSVDLDPRDYAKLWRAARRVRECHSGPRVVAVDRVDSRTGAVRTRRVRRRWKVKAGAGFVIVNDGPAFATQLAKYASQLAAERAAPLADGSPRPV
jgi:hypothetical protein